MQKTLWSWISKNSVGVFLASLFLLISAGVSVLTYQKYMLFVASPLENLEVELQHDPIVLGQDAIFDFKGNFDRDVLCEMVSFKLYVSSQNTNDVFVLDSRHIAKVPKLYVRPGQNIPIHFALNIPEHFTAGRWSTEFVGTYYCKKGIFGHLKTQSVQGPSFTSVYLAP